MIEKKISSVDAYVSSQFRSWDQKKHSIDADREQLSSASRVATPFVTIAREYGCGGYDIAERAVTIINEEMKPSQVWAVYDRKILDSIIADMGLSEKLAETLSNTARNNMNNFLRDAFSSLPSQVSVYKKLAEIVRTLAANGRVIIVGRAGNAITRDMPGGLHAKIVATMDWKVERMSKLLGVKPKEAERVIIEKGGEREEYLKGFVKFNSADVYNFHMVLNNSNMSVDEAARLIIAAMDAKGHFSR